MAKNPPASAGDAKDVGLVPGLGRSLGVSTAVFLLGNGQRRLAGYIHGAAKSQTQLSGRAVCRFIVLKFSSFI